ncbi:heavy metal translocating P-type ATPase [Halobacillus mangrovi]|uniref:Heavy metal translocating P-type ATPase n=1 Tax=Halobacillus mangrovi TaxID=402384 RepID=A0A1W5ZYN5_9BACI|nr:heavy metal translocating P-type ATPase [Halobacillus mangrovi]ARI78373.1 heavy metal translocating P-type ATPase [Halobacillus mangrovi]
MASETQSIHNRSLPSWPAWMSPIKDHAELIAALLSGLLVLIAWMGESYFTASTYVTLHIIAFVIGGFAKAKEGLEETVKEKELNVELLMILAAIGSASIGYWTEGAILIFIFALSGALETYTMNKSQKELSSLMSLQPEEALKVTEEGYETTSVASLQISDLILVKPGERVPADGIITKGETSIDESAITGESVPVTKGLSKEVFAGTVNLNGSIVVEVTKKSTDTLFQKIITMVQSAQSEKTPSQLFIERFESTYVKVVLLVVGVMLFLPHFLFGWSWMDTIYRAMILLVVASPCALVASIMPATLSAISNGARNGLLFKGGVHLENLAHLQAIAFDKTGTLTKGKPEVTDALYAEGEDEKSVLGVAASIEQQSNHPLAKAIVDFACRYDITLSNIDDMKDVSGNGVSARFNEETWKIGKADFVGKEEAAAFQNGIGEELQKEGKTVIFVQRNESIAAIFALKDTVRKETKQAIETLKKRGVYTIMLTGDNPTTADAIAKEVGVDHFIPELLPEEKVNELKILKEHFDQVGMVGDGINDAPALATANVGIAMGEGTDVALETADVVLMKNDLPRISQAIHLSTRMNRIVKQNVVFSISVIMLLIISNFLQILDLPLGVIGHEGSTILVILNGLRLLKS